MPRVTLDTGSRRNPLRDSALPPALRLGFFHRVHSSYDSYDSPRRRACHLVHEGHVVVFCDGVVSAISNRMRGKHASAPELWEGPPWTHHGVTAAKPRKKRASCSAPSCLQNGVAVAVVFTIAVSILGVDLGARQAPPWAPSSTHGRRCRLGGCRPPR